MAQSGADVYFMQLELYLFLRWNMFFINLQLVLYWKGIYIDSIVSIFIAEKWSAKWN